MRNLKYLLANASNDKGSVLQLYFIGGFLQANIKHRAFVNLNSKHGKYFLEYYKYFGRPLILKKSMYGILNYGKMFSDELTNWLIDEAGFKHSQCIMYIYYKYAPD